MNPTIRRIKNVVINKVKRDGIVVSLLEYVISCSGVRFETSLILISIIILIIFNYLNLYLFFLGFWAIIMITVITAIALPIVNNNLE